MTNDTDKTTAERVNNLIDLAEWRKKTRGQNLEERCAKYLSLAVKLKDAPARRPNAG